MTLSFSSIVPLVAVAVISSGTTFVITKSVCSNSESQVVAYLKGKEAEERARLDKQRKAEEEVGRRMAEVKKKLLED